MSNKNIRESLSIAQVDHARPNKRPLHDGEARGIFDGAERVGHLVMRDGEFLAFSKRHEPLGRFDTAPEAAAAVLRQAQSERGR